MTFDEAMHEECEFCGEAAQWHRLTNGGNFYCLLPNSSNSWRRGNISKWTPVEQKQWAISKAKCNDLKKSYSLSSMKGLADTIIKAIRKLPEPVGEQLSL